MGIGSAIVPSRTVTVGQLHRESTADKGLEALVYRGQRDSRCVLPNTEEYFVGCRVDIRAREVAVHSCALVCKPLSAGLKCLSEPLVTIVWMHDHTLPRFRKGCQAEQTTIEGRRSCGGVPGVDQQPQTVEDDDHRAPFVSDNACG